MAEIPEDVLRDMIATGTGFTRTNADGSQERIDQNDVWAVPETDIPDDVAERARKLATAFLTPETPGPKDIEFAARALMAERAAQIERDAGIVENGTGFQCYETPRYDDIGMQEEDNGDWAMIDAIAAAIREQKQ